MVAGTCMTVRTAWEVSVLFFHHVSPGHQTPVVRFGSRHFHFLSYLDGLSVTPTAKPGIDCRCSRPSGMAQALPLMDFPAPWSPMGSGLAGATGFAHSLEHGRVQTLTGLAAGIAMASSSFIASNSVAPVAPLRGLWFPAWPVVVV